MPGNLVVPSTLNSTQVKQRKLATDCFDAPKAVISEPQKFIENN